MSDAPKNPRQHLYLSVQLSDAPNASSDATRTSYLTAHCQEYAADGSCKSYTHEVDSDDVRISAI